MSEGNGSSNGNGNSEWIQVFASFHARHKDGRGKKLKFTAVFNAAMEAFVTDPDAPIEWRVLAFVWRYSWGNNSDVAVEKIGGDRIGQQYMADRLGVDKP